MSFLPATGSVTDKEQNELLGKSILGSGHPNDLAALPEHMVLCIKQFGHLYEDVPVLVNNYGWNEAQSVVTTAVDGDGGGLTYIITI